MEDWTGRVFPGKANLILERTLGGNELTLSVGKNPAVNSPTKKNSSKRGICGIDYVYCQNTEEDGAAWADLW
jgi:hypothetical protein